MHERLPALDGLRAIAILIVMISHADLGHVVPGGLGVTIFFFLSGYLITTLMATEWCQTGSLRFGAFYRRRAVRILPPMWIAIALTVALSAFGLIGVIEPSGLPLDLLFLSNYFPNSRIQIPLWSLDVEEHFYLLFPLLFFFVRGRNVAIICSALCIATLQIRISVASTGDLGNIYYWSHTRLDSILFGCILATWNNPATGDRTYIGGQVGYAVLGAGLLMATLVIRDPMFRETLRYSVQGVALFLLFNFALRNTGLVARALASRPLKIVADLSYFLYLIHVPLLAASGKLPAPVPVRYAVAFGLSFLLALFVRHQVELPLLRWRKRIETKPGVKVSTI